MCGILESPRLAVVIEEADLLRDEVIDLARRTMRGRAAHVVDVDREGRLTVPVGQVDPTGRSVTAAPD